MPKTILQFLTILIFSTHANCLVSGEYSRQEYLKLVSEFPKIVTPCGNYRNGEIQVVLDPEEMASIEEEFGREVGVLMRDNYWIWVNDACVFPNGKKGIYGRIFLVNSLETNPGVAVMPITNEGKVILNCNFRHATRSWEIELPRGLVDKNEDAEMAARRETVEETGMIVGDLILLGEMTPDTGMVNTVVPIYAAHVIEKKDTQHADSEAIEEILCMSISEIKLAFLQGYCERNIRGTNQKIKMRDPFLAFALFMYELKVKK